MPSALVAQFIHETNTFSRKLAGLDAFAQRELLEGSAVVDELSETNSEIGGFVAGARSHGWRIVPALATEATPCGMVRADTWHTLSRKIIDTLKKDGPVEIVLLALHGAMVSETAPDADGRLVETVRAEVGPRALIGCTLDLHANVSASLAGAANILIPYSTYPHVDMRERGMELVDLLDTARKHGVTPRSYVFRNRQLDGCDHGRSSGRVMPELLGLAQRATTAGISRVGVCAGFPWADVEHAGPSVVVSGTLQSEAAERACRDVLNAMWQSRSETSLVAYEVTEGLRIGLQHTHLGRRVVLADYSDNPGGGGYGTTTGLLAAMLGSPGPAAVFAPLCDPSAATICARSGVGSRVRVTLGEQPAAPFSGPPLQVEGEVLFCNDVSFRATGPMWTNREMRLGPTATLRCGTVDVVITSFPLQVTDPSYLTAAGIDLPSKQLIAIKSMQHFRAAFAPMVDEIIFVDSGGLVCTKLHRFPYRSVRRPIWPLDSEAPQG